MQFISTFVRLSTLLKLNIKSNAFLKEKFLTFPCSTIQCNMLLLDKMHGPAFKHLHLLSSVTFTFHLCIARYSCFQVFFAFYVDACISTESVFRKETRKERKAKTHPLTFCTKFDITLNQFSFSILLKSTIMAPKINEIDVG